LFSLGLAAFNISPSQNESCFSGLWTYLMPHVPANLIQSVHEKGSVRQNLSLETPECLFYVSPVPLFPFPFAPRHEPFSLGPAQSSHLTTLHLSQILAKLGACLPTSQ
jgi:hypothetical protein